MPTIGFDAALGIHEKAYHLRSRRSEVLANNIANADTPGYKAKDIDFRQALQRESQAVGDMQVATTHAGHNAHILEQSATDAVKYRNPMQPSLDGNSVDAHMEKAAFTRNAMRFQASHKFLSGSFKGLISAIKGQSQ